MDTAIARVYVEVDSRSLTRVFPSVHSDDEVPVRFTFEGGAMRGTCAFSESVPQSPWQL